MNEDKIRRDAADARRLRADPAFIAILGKVRDEQMCIFAQSGASDTLLREEAHTILRALSKIEQYLDSDVLSGEMLERNDKRAAP